MGTLPGWCVRGRVCGKRGPPSLHADYPLVMAQPLPSSLSIHQLSASFPGSLLTSTPASPLASAGVAALALPALLPSLSRLSLAFSPTASRSGQASPSRPESPRPPFDL